MNAQTPIGLPWQTTDEPALQLDSVVQALRAVRTQWRSQQGRSQEPSGRELPSPQAVEAMTTALSTALFPMRLGPPDLRQESEDFYIGHTLDTALRILLGQARLELRHSARIEGALAAASSSSLASAKEPLDALPLVRQFATALPEIRRLLDTDAIAAFHGDPAAHSVDEVLLCYPGMRALIHHRLAHQLYRLGLPLLARIMAEQAHAATGIDIHPGAQIGPGCFIDHGTGVVIGETTVIGKDVRIYQAVTLGAKRFEQDEHGHLVKGAPRHPIVEDEVVIYAGATILGRVTIGRGAVIGGNVWLMQDVAPGRHISQASLQEAAQRRVPGAAPAFPTQP